MARCIICNKLLTNSEEKKSYDYCRECLDATALDAHGNFIDTTAKARGHNSIEVISLDEAIEEGL